MKCKSQMACHQNNSRRFTFLVESRHLPLKPPMETLLIWHGRTGNMCWCQTKSEDGVEKEDKRVSENLTIEGGRRSPGEVECTGEKNDEWRGIVDSWDGMAVLIAWFFEIVVWELACLHRDER